jgi:hypothetical protein
MVLANILNHLGMQTTVVTSPNEVGASLDKGPWDILFVQGTSKPYPGKELASLVSGRCTRSNPNVVLLTRSGDTLLSDAGNWSVVGLLQWPFSPEKVRKTLGEMLPKGKPTYFQRS